jgi:hypothetical protein
MSDVHKYQRARVWKLRPQKQARVFVIDGVSDLRWLQSHYPQFPGGKYKHGFVFPELDRWEPLLDWPRIAAFVDAVRLSARGFNVLAHSRGPLSDWSVPSTLWMRWSFLGEGVELPRPKITAQD